MNHLPLELELAAEARTSVVVSRHDRRNLEIKIEHRSPEPTRERVESMVELCFILPPAVGISSTSFSASDFFTDLRAYSRFKTPRIELEDIVHPRGARSPLAALATQLARSPTGPLPRRVEAALGQEARLLCCVTRRSAARAARRVQVVREEDRSEASAQLASQLTELLARWRQLASQVRDRRPHPRTRDTFSACDEALSLEVEACVSRLLVDAGDTLGAGGGALVALARSERRLRAARGDRSAASPSAADEDTRAQFWDQASLLKKFVSQALYLRLRRHTGAQRLEHVAKALAAALAMTWTVSLQVATVMVLGVELNTRVDVRMVLLFSLIAVGGYILKDRIKDTLGRRLAAAIPRWLYDRRLDLLPLDSERVVGEVRERVQLLAPSAMSGEMRMVRAAIARSPIALWTHNDRLMYQRRVVIFPREAVREFPRMAGLTDVLRVNVARWVRTLDARKKSVALVDADGEARVAQVPNRYWVDVLARISDDQGVRHEAFRVILTHRGVERVEGLDVSALPPDAVGQLRGAVPRPG